jgi:hypothetical protein
MDSRLTIVERHVSDERDDLDLLVEPDRPVLVEKRAIEWKHAARRCPSCGRAARDCSCDLQ